MTRANRTVWLLTAILLLAGQVAATAHAYAHEVGTAADAGCATCVHSSQLAAAANDSTPASMLPCAIATYRVPHNAVALSAERLVPRQRGPPLPASILA